VTETRVGGKEGNAGDRGRPALAGLWNLEHC
jgi:hypothetical protein